LPIIWGEMLQLVPGKLYVICETFIIRGFLCHTLSSIEFLTEAKHGLQDLSQ